MQQPKAVPAGRDVFSTGQVAAFLGVSPHTVIRWAKNDGLKCYAIPTTRPGRVPGDRTHRRIRLADLIAFSEKHGLPLEFEAHTEGVA